MKILITGGCGYVGLSLLEHLVPLKNITEIIIYDNLLRGAESFFIGKKLPYSSKVRFIQGDILDNFTLIKSLKGIDVVFHLAAKVTTPYSDINAHEFDQVNNWGTACVIDAVERSNSVKKFIYASSVSVYGNTNGETVTEETKPVPDSFYGISKLKGENHISRISDKMETFIFRIGNVYGYNNRIRLDAVINKMIFNANFKNKIEIHGSGKQKRAFVDVDELGRLLTNVIIRKEISPGLYNVVTNNNSINSIAETVKSLYPNVELLFLNQHLPMRSITTKSIHKIGIEENSQDLLLDLEHIKNQFRF